MPIPQSSLDLSGRQITEESREVDRALGGRLGKGGWREIRVSQKDGG